MLQKDQTSMKCRQSGR